MVSLPVLHILVKLFTHLYVRKHCDNLQSGASMYRSGNPLFRLIYRLCALTLLLALMGSSLPAQAEPAEQPSIQQVGQYLVYLPLVTSTTRSSSADLIDAAEANIGNDAIKGLHVLAELAVLHVKAALKSGADEERTRATGTLHYLDSLVVHVNETFHDHLLHGASTLLRVAMAQMAARASSALELQHG